MSTKVVDKGWKKIERQLREEATYDVGVYGERAEVAFYLEMGTEDIPEFAFMRETLEKNGENVERLVGKQLDRIIRTKGAVSMKPEEVANLIKKEMQKTIEDKGLVDTGRLRDSVQVREDV